MRHDTAQTTGQEAFQLTRLRREIHAHMDKVATFEIQQLRAPERSAAMIRSAARLARLWAWATARRDGDQAAAVKALTGVARGPLDSDMVCERPGFVRDVDDLVRRALRLERLFGAPVSTTAPSTRLARCGHASAIR